MPEGDDLFADLVSPGGGAAPVAAPPHDDLFADLVTPVPTDAQRIQSGRAAAGIREPAIRSPQAARQFAQTFQPYSLPEQIRAGTVAQTQDVGYPHGGPPPPEQVSPMLPEIGQSAQNLAAGVTNLFQSPFALAEALGRNVIGAQNPDLNNNWSPLASYLRLQQKQQQGAQAIASYTPKSGLAAVPGEVQGLLPYVVAPEVAIPEMIQNRAQESTARGDSPESAMAQAVATGALATFTPKVVQKAVGGLLDKLGLQAIERLVGQGVPEAAAQRIAAAGTSAVEGGLTGAGMTAGEMGSQTLAGHPETAPTVEDIIDSGLTLSGLGAAGHVVPAIREVSQNRAAIRDAMSRQAADAGLPIERQLQPTTERADRQQFVPYRGAEPTSVLPPEAGPGPIEVTPEMAAAAKAQAQAETIAPPSSLPTAQELAHAQGTPRRPSPGSHQEETHGQTQAGVHLRNDAQNGMEAGAGEVVPPAESPAVIEARRIIAEHEAQSKPSPAPAPSPGEPPGLPAPGAAPVREGVAAGTPEVQAGGAEPVASATSDFTQLANQPFRLSESADVATRQALGSVVRALGGTGSKAQVFREGPDTLRVRGSKGAEIRVKIASEDDLARVRAAAEQQGGQPGTPNGWYENGTIHLTPNVAGGFTFNHEAIHAFKDLGLITDAEFARLARVAARNPEIVKSVAERYPNASPELRSEEHVAHFFERLGDGRVKLANVSTWQKVKDFIRDVGHVMTRGLVQQSENRLVRDVAAGKPLERTSVKASVSEPKFSKRITDKTEEAGRPEREIVNPIDAKLSDEQKVAALNRLTEENRPLVADILAKVKAMGLSKASDNVKAPEKILSKANRPSILAEKPWYGVEHIRDSYRFKAPIQRLDQIPDVIKAITDSGATIVKYDSQKLFNPKEWGWRFVGLDVRMPNGQLVEAYMPFEAMDAKNVKGPNHDLFEKWRNVDRASMTPEIKNAYRADAKTSRESYGLAFSKALAAAGMDETAARAAFIKIEDRVASLTEANSLPNSAALPNDQGGGTFQVLPPSHDATMRADGVSPSKSTATRPVSTSSQASSIEPPFADTLAPEADKARTAYPDKQPPKFSQPEEPQRGRPDLANPGIVQPVREVVNEVDQARTESGEPGVRSDSEVQAEAQARFKKNPEGEKKAILTKIRQGGQLDDKETLIAHALINRDTLKALTGTNADRLAEAQHLIWSYRQGGTEQARAFRMRRDQSLSPEDRIANLGQAILTPPVEVTDRVKELLNNGQVDQANKIMRTWAQRAKQTVDGLKKQGIDLEDLALPEKLTNPVAMARTLNRLSALRAEWGDKVMEYWINAVLSGPTTHVVNQTSNAAATAWEYALQRPVEALVSQIPGLRGKQDVATVGELRHVYTALLKSLPQAMRNTFRSFQAETDILEFERNAQANAGKMDDYKGAAIGGWHGRLIRTPGRALAAGDSLWKTIIARAEVTALAYRRAKAENHSISAKDLQATIEKQLNDPSSPVWEDALLTAKELTFQKPMEGKVGQAIASARSYELPGGLKPLAFVVPFVRTPWNIFATGLRKSPLGSVTLAARMARKGLRAASKTDDGKWDYSAKHMAGHVAEQIIAWGGMAALYSLAQSGGTKDKDSRPFITGTGTAGFGKDRGKREYQQRSEPVTSIRIGDTWYNYGRLEPIATTLAAMVDLAREAGSDKPNGEKVTTLANKIAGQVNNKTFLQGTSDILNVLTNPDQNAERYATTFASSWVPNVIRQPLRSAQENIPESKPLPQVEGESGGMIALRRLGQQAFPLEDTGPVPKVDVWGREIPRYPGAQTTVVERILRGLSPVQIKGDTANDLDLWLRSWNETHPDDAHWPETPPAYRIIDGKRVNYTGAEYHDLLVDAGKLAVESAKKRRLTARPADEDSMKELDQIIRQSRAQARQALARRLRQKLDKNQSLADK